MYLPNYNQTVGGSGGSANQVDYGLPTPVNNGSDVNNFNDEESWQQYLEILNQSNLYNSAQAEIGRNFNLMMRDTHLESMMNQLKRQGINPILAVSNGLSLPAYGSSISAQAYSGTAPYSNSARVESAQLKAIASIISSVIGALGNLGSSALKAI